MAFAELNGLRMRYEFSGLESGPVLVFSHPLGTDLTMWDGQAADFGKRFRVLRYDKRGAGKHNSGGTFGSTGFFSSRPAEHAARHGLSTPNHRLERNDVESARSLLLRHDHGRSGSAFVLGRESFADLRKVRRASARDRRSGRRLLRGLGAERAAR